MYGAVFAAAYAMSCALFGVIADLRADSRERVILEEYLSGLHEFMLFEELYYFWYRRVNGAAFLAHGLFAVKAAFSFCYYM